MTVRFLSPERFAARHALEARWRAEREELQRRATTPEERRSLHQQLRDRAEYDARCRDELQLQDDEAGHVAADQSEQEQQWRELVREGRITGSETLSFTDFQPTEET